MEFQKLQRIIAEVLNISEDKITPESTFIDDLKLIHLMFIRLLQRLKTSLKFRFQMMLLKIL